MLNLISLLPDVYNNYSCQLCMWNLKILFIFLHSFSTSLKKLEYDTNRNVYISFSFALKNPCGHKYSWKRMKFLTTFYIRTKQSRLIDISLVLFYSWKCLKSEFKFFGVFRFYWNSKVKLYIFSCVQVGLELLQK